MLISPIALTAKGKILKNIQTKVRRVGLININTKEKQNAPPFMKVVYDDDEDVNVGLFLINFMSE